MKPLQDSSHHFFAPQMDPLRHFLLRIDYALLSIEPAVVPRADGIGEAVKALLDAAENCGDYCG